MSHRSSVILALSVAAFSTADAQSVDPASPQAGAREFYAAYESALKLHRRDTLARFYHPSGALIVVNGSRMAPSNAGIDSVYRGPWEGPTFFAFDSLHFDALDSASIAVSGRFRWLPRSSVDTARYHYFALLTRTPAGWKIRVEHETELPKSSR